MEKKKIVVVCGPTGTGKTETAIALAKKFNGELINADSRQVYKHIPILTNTGKLKDKSHKSSDVIPAKAGISDMRNTHLIHSVPIHLIQILEPWERFNVFEWRERALEIIEDIISRGKVPVLAGGTGLYIDSLIKNYELQITNNIDWNKRKELESKSVEELINILESRDLDLVSSLNKSDRNNKRRLIRLVEKSENTSPQPSPQSRGGDTSYEYHLLYPEYNWDELKKKLEIRVENMIEKGAVKEVKDLIEICEKHGLEISIDNYPAIGIMGVKQIFDFLEQPMQGDNGHFRIQEVFEKIKIAHRQYARRQRTWFEGERRGYDLQRFSDAKNAVLLAEKFLKD